LDPGVEPGADNCTIGRMAQHTSVPSEHARATPRLTTTHELRQPPVVVFPTIPLLTDAAARALLRIVLDATTGRSRQSCRGPQPMEPASGTLRER
jgi:hypothetical protein